MTDKKIDEKDLLKAMSTLQDLAKGHSSKGTATTKVETMAGVSGATQLFHTAANSDPGGWAGSSWRGEGWEDSIDANGTDMGAVKAFAKSVAKSVMSKISKGESLSAREVDFVSKGGLNFLKDKEDAEKAFPMDKKDEVEKAHPDAEEDAKQIKDMVKPDAMKKDVKKSLLDHAADSAAVSSQLEVSDFLASFVQVMHKSLASAEARIVDRVLSAIAQSESEQASVQKSMAGALATLGDVLTVQQQRIDQVESGAARAPKGLALVKSVDSPNEGNNAQELTKSQVTDRLLDLVKKSEATPQDVIKYDSTGEISQPLMRKVLGR